MWKFIIFIMRYADIKFLNDIQMRRCVGICWSDFNKILSEIEADYPSRGRPCKLECSDQLLLYLVYYYEKKTLFNLSLDYGVSEPTASRIVIKVRNKIQEIGEFNFLIP